MLISEAFSLYARDVIAFRNQSRKTEEHHFAALKSLMGYLGDISIAELSLEQVRNWKDSMDKRNLSSNTIRGYLNKLRVVLAFLNKTGTSCLDHELIPLPKRVNAPVDFLSREEVKKLILVARQPCRGYPAINRLRNQAIISMLYGSGIRVGELCQLSRNDIQFDTGTFTVVGKGNKVRLCFLDDRTNLFLKEYLRLRCDNHDALFLANQTSARMRPGLVQRIVADIGKKSNLDKRIHPHIFRHSFATDFLRNNGNMRYLQTILGHSSLETTQLYSHVVDHDLKAVYAKFHKV